MAALLRYLPNWDFLIWWRQPTTLTTETLSSGASAQREQSPPRHPAPGAEDGGRTSADLRLYISDEVLLRHLIVATECEIAQSILEPNEDAETKAFEWYQRQIDGFRAKIVALESKRDELVQSAVATLRARVDACIQDQKGHYSLLRSIKENKAGSVMKQRRALRAIYERAPRAVMPAMRD